MEALRAPLRELGEFEEIQKKLNRKEPVCLGLSGCVDSQKLHMIFGLGEGFRYKLIITYSDQRMREIYEDYKFYDRNVCMYPAKDLIFFPGGYSRQPACDRALESAAAPAGGRASDHCDDA